jgi:hypothetical protein
MLMPTTRPLWEGERMHRVTELTDGAVAIRPAVEAHVDDLHAAVAASLPELDPWFPWCHEGYERAEMAEFVAPCEVDAGGKFALGDTLSGAGEAFEAARDAADER